MYYLEWIKLLDFKTKRKLSKKSALIDYSAIVYMVASQKIKAVHSNF